jgi:hypothetical protein
MLRVLGIYEQLTSWVLVTVPHPADDPFFQVPDALDELSPGEVVDARSVEVRMLRRRVKVDAWQVRFRSTDTRGAAIVGVTTVMVPRRPFRRPVRPLLSYQPAIDSLGATADPSYTLQRGDQPELPFILRALRRGWVVVATDYTGPTHAFAVGPVAARLVLDGIRAAIAFEPAGLDTATTPVGLWGYSGGAQATLLAAEQHPTYAPELDIVASAAGGITGDPTSAPHIFEAGSLLSGVWFGAMIGISRETDVDLIGSLTPEGQALVASAAEMSIVELLLSFPYLRWGDYLTVPDVFEIPGMRSFIDVNDFGRAAPRSPLHLYHSVRDQNRPLEDVEQLAETYRRGGAEVSCRPYRFGEHMVVALTGARGALRFLAQRLDPPASMAEAPARSRRSAGEAEDVLGDDVALDL